jgi:octaprenyl-diphosphate synthase
MTSAFLAATPEALQGETATRIADEVAEVEAILCEEIESDVELVRNVCELTLQAGGKRLRPALCALSALAANPDADLPRARRLGASLEMVHMATLIHDDVIDRTDLRRGRPTASSVFGTTASILSGDVLLAKSMRILALDGDLDVIRTVASVVVDLSEGEVAELETRGQFDLDEAAYFEILRRKTATFLAACCGVGGRCAGAPPEVIQALEAFGLTLGLAFQVADDLLDYFGDPAITGKPVGTDFAEGCATLPLIRLRNGLSQEELMRVAPRFGTPQSPDDLADVRKLMNERSIFESCQSNAFELIAVAKGELDVLPRSAERDLLAAVADFAANRIA